MLFVVEAAGGGEGETTEPQTAAAGHVTDETCLSVMSCETHAAQHWTGGWQHTQELFWSFGHSAVVDVRKEEADFGIVAEKSERN